MILKINKYCCILFGLLMINGTIFSQEKADSILAKEHYDLGLKLRADRKYDSSIIYLEKAVSINRKMNDQENLINSLNELTVSLWWDYRFPYALKTAKEVLELSENHYGGIHRSMAIAWHNIGNCHLDQKLFQASLKAFYKSLEIKKLLPEKDDEGMISAYNNIGLVYTELDQFDEALDAFQKCVDIFINSNGEVDPIDIEMTYNNIGTIYLNLNNYKIALEYYEKSYEVLKNTYKQNDPRMFRPLKNIGLAYMRLQSFTMSANYYKLALDVAKNGLPESKVADMYNNIALNDYYRGDYESATDNFKMSLAIFQKQKGALNLRQLIGNLYNNIGLIHIEKGNYSEAIEYSLNSLRIKKEIFGEEHSVVASTYNNLSVLLKDTGSKNLALDYNCRALKIREKLFDETHESLIESYWNH